MDQAQVLRAVLDILKPLNPSPLASAAGISSSAWQSNDVSMAQVHIGKKQNKNIHP